MRIAFDVSPLSHPRTGIGNYIRGSLRGLVEAARATHEIVAFAPTSPQGRKAIPRGAGRASPSSVRLELLPFAHLWRTAWSGSAAPASSASSGRSTCSTSPTGCTRRSAAASARRRSTTSCRSAFPSGCTGRTRAHARARSTGTRRGRATSLFANSAFTARRRVELLGVPAERVRVAPPGVDARVRRRTASAPTSARPYVLTVATLEPRKNLATLVDACAAARRTSSRSPSSAPRAGASSRARPARRGPRSATSTTTSSRGSTAAPRRSSTRRGSRASGCRCSRRWRAACPSSRRRTRRWTRRAATPPCAPIPTAPEAIAAAIEEALARRDELVRAGSRTRRAFTWRATGRAFLDGYVAAVAMRVGLDVSPLVQTRAGTARYVAGCCASSSGSVELVPLRPGGSGRGCDGRSRRGLVPARACRGCARAASTCSTARPSAGRCARRVPARRHRPRPRRAAPSRGVQPLDARLQPRLRAARRAGGDARDRRLRVHEARARRAARRARGARSRVVPNGDRATCSRQTGPRPRATTCSPSARSSRGRTSRACEAARRARHRAPHRRRAGLGRGRRRRRRGSAACPTTSSPRSTAARSASSTRRCTRASGSRSLEAMACGAPVVTSRAGRRRRSPAARPCSSTRSTSPRSRAGSRRRSARRAELRRRPRARAALQLGRTAPRNASRSIAEAARVTLVVLDADVLGRQRTGDETYVENLLRELPGCGGRSPVRGADAPSRPRARRRRGGRAPGALAGAADGVVACRVLLRRLRPALAHFQHALPLALSAARRSSPSTTSRSSATRRVMARRDRLDLPAGGAARGAAGRPRARRLRADEARPRRAVRRRAGEDRRHAARRRRRLRPGRRRRRRLPSLRRRDPGAEGPARRGRRGARGRAAARRRRARAATAALADELARRGADVRGYVDEGRARGALPRRGVPPAAVALRGLRAARARGDGVRHARRRDAGSGAARGRRRRGGLRRAGELAAGDPRARSRERDRLRAAGLERARRVHAGRRRRGGRVAVYREVLGL